MNSICIIGVYFGHFNNYFPLWLKSCENNQKIDFRIYTDATYEGIIPKNVTFVKMDLKQLKKLASRKIGIDVNLQRPYKCCDLKPMYGLIFEDDLKKYEYWGECDFDLIWGDLNSFLEKYDYKKYDKFLSLGHLSLYRNNPQNNKVFMLSGDYKKGGYKKVLRSEKNCVFDEENGISSIYINNNLPFFRKRIFADITPLYKRFTLSPFSSWKDSYSKNYKYQIFYYENKKIYRDFFSKGKLYSEEFMYIHFRSRGNFTLREDVLNGVSFYITNEGFILKKGKTTVDIINKYNKCDSLFKEKCKYWVYIMNYQIKRSYRLLRRILKKVML